jgi:hypothetical protein
MVLCYITVGHLLSSSCSRIQQKVSKRHSKRGRTAKGDGVGLPRFLGHSD